MTSRLSRGWALAPWRPAGLAATSARGWTISDLATTGATVVGHAAIRWNVDTYLEEGKALLGLDHSQLTSATATARFWHRVAGTSLHLDEVGAALGTAGSSGATLGAALRPELAAHRYQLLGWRDDPFQRGTSGEEIHQLLAACVRDKRKERTTNGAMDRQKAFWKTQPALPLVERVPESRTLFDCL